MGTVSAIVLSAFSGKPLLRQFQVSTALAVEPNLWYLEHLLILNITK